MIKRYFKSNYGYNNYIREGKIYNFTSYQSIKYLLEVNRDLVDLTFVMKNFLNNYVKYYLIKKIISKEIIFYLNKRELGLLNFNYFLKKYENKYKSEFIFNKL